MCATASIASFLDAPVFAASATTHKAARASPIMAHHPLLPGNFRIIFHDNDVCDFSLNECIMGLVAYEMQQLKRRLMARDAKDGRLTPGMRVFLSSRVPRLTIQFLVPPCKKLRNDLHFWLVATSHLLIANLSHLSSNPRKVMSSS